MFFESKVTLPGHRARPDFWLAKGNRLSRKSNTIQRLAGSSAISTAGDDLALSSVHIAWVAIALQIRTNERLGSLHDLSPATAIARVMRISKGLRESA